MQVARARRRRSAGDDRGRGDELVLALTALGDSIQFFRSPAELAAKSARPGAVRLGGLIEAGSVRWEVGVKEPP